MPASAKTVMANGFLLLLSVAAFLVGCASAPSTWHREGATQEMTANDIAGCQTLGGQIGYGLVAGDDFVQRCMEARGYRPAY